VGGWGAKKRRGREKIVPMQCLELVKQPTLLQVLSVAMAKKKKKKKKKATSTAGKKTPRFDLKAG